MLLILFIFLPTITSLKVIDTSYGKVRGITDYLYDGTEAYIFKKVPFAKPPLNNLRFALPEPPEKWYGIKDASKYSPACLSDSHKSSSPQKYISEDCLYLNIFTSAKCLIEKCSVIIYYHGGAFNTDAATMFPDKFIVERYVRRDVVFVIPAFRLGVFGLFYLGDTAAVPENLALHDAVASLNFVHNEILHFGGDPTQVTIMGHSSGGNLVNIFGFSELIDPHRKLFQKMIALNAPMTFDLTPTLVAKSYEIARRLECYDPDALNHTSIQIVNCLRKIDAKILLATQKDMELDDLNFRRLILGAPFMRKNETIRELKMNTPARKMLNGVAEQEFFKPKVPKFIGIFLDFDNPEEVFNEFIRTNLSITTENAEQDAVYVSAATYSAAMVNAGGEVFLYETRQKPSSMHISDMQYFIGIHKTENRTSDQDILDSIYSEMLVNFTKFDDPLPGWEPFDPSKNNYLVLAFDVKNDVYPKMEKDFHETEVDFWMINMTAYDKYLTVNNHQKTGLSAISTTKPNYHSTPFHQTWSTVSSTPDAFIMEVGNSYSIFSQWWFYLIILFVIIVIINFLFLIRKSFGERTPLLE